MAKIPLARFVRSLDVVGFAILPADDHEDSANFCHPMQGRTAIIVIKAITAPRLNHAQTPKSWNSSPRAERLARARWDVTKGCPHDIPLAPASNARLGQS